MHQVLQPENAEIYETASRKSCCFSFAIEVAYVVYKFCSSQAAATSVVSSF